MAIEVAGFAQALGRCLDFNGVEPSELETVLAATDATFEMAYVEPALDTRLVRSGSAFTHLVFIQSGVVVPWQYPHSELAGPFLLGEHELLMDAERWVATYSALTPTTVVQIPVSAMMTVLTRLPRIRDRMHQLVTRRLARFYWTSLATTGAPDSRVAAALVSRLALDGIDYGNDRTIAIKQKDMARLTTMSRSAVAAGLADLTHTGVIGLGAGARRFSGVVVVPEVSRLKDAAFAHFKHKDLPLLLDLDER